MKERSSKESQEKMKKKGKYKHDKRWLQESESKKVSDIHKMKKNNNPAVKKISKRRKKNKWRRKEDRLKTERKRKGLEMLRKSK